MCCCLHRPVCLPVVSCSALSSGLVFPRFATSKAEMVAAGVIPIDRLTDIRAPVDVVAARCGQPQLEAVYGIHLGPRSRDPAAAAEDTAAASSSSNTAAAAAGPSSTQPGPAAAASSAAAAGDTSLLSVGMRLLVSLARARGWAASGGLPDEVRAGRQILKDYTNGKLLYCKLPTGQQQTGFAPLVAPLPGTVNGMQLQQQQPVKQPQQQVIRDSRAQQQQAPGGQQQLSQQQQEAGGSSTAVTAAADQPPAAAAGSDAAAADPVAAADDDDDDVDAAASTLLLSEADLELMEGLGIGPKGKPRRPDHKFHKKAARSKGTRGLQADAGGYDGAALSTGKKGGLVRVGGY